MQPSDNTPAQTPVPEPPKQSFWSKLFGKKPPVVLPPHESLAPPPQLDDKAADISAAPASDLQAAAPQTDSIIGIPQANDLSAPDANGEVTSLPIDIPTSIESPTEGTTAPTVQLSEPALAPAQQQPADTTQPTPAPQPYQQPQPVAPVQPAPVVEPVVPPVQPLPPVNPQPQQPTRPDQQ